MRSRALREGSVGLLILVGAGLFAGLVIWLQDVRFGRKSYPITVEFLDARGLQVGTPVRYRGVTIGKVMTIQPKTMTVEVLVEISEPGLLIPSDAIVEAQSSALLGEKFLDITPRSALPSEQKLAGPLDSKCDRSRVICEGSKLPGTAVADLTDLVRSMNQIAALLNNPQLINSIEKTANNAATATAGVSKLTKDLSVLSQSVQGEIGGLSDTIASAQQTAEDASQAMTTVSTATVRTADSLSVSANQAASSVSSSVNQVAGSLNQSVNQVAGSVGQTARTLNQTAEQANQILTENRGAIAKTLTSLTQTSDSLKGAVNELTPVLGQVRKSEFVTNLERLTENLRIVSANLRVASNTLNDPANMVMLQQTLDAARVTFQNAQKITSDLDELTGDPQFRGNLRRLVNGLSGLVATTQQLNQQVVLAGYLDPQGASPEQAQQLTLLSGRVNVASLELVKQLTELSQAIEAGEAGSAGGKAIATPSPAQ